MTTRYIVIKVDPDDPTTGTLVSDQNQTFYQREAVAQRKADWYNENKEGTYKVIPYALPKAGEINVGGDR